MTKKVSFDWDSCLNKYQVLQNLAKVYMASPEYTVYICTSRHLNPPISATYTNRAIYEFAQSIKLPTENIIFTNGKDKFSFLTDFYKHYDDDTVEIELLKEFTNCKAILVPDDL
jgi:hypothetical protein